MIHFFVGACFFLSVFMAGLALGSYLTRHSNCASIKSNHLPFKSIFRNGPAQWGLILFTVSGFCAMGYEVLWTRLLGLIVGPTTYYLKLAEKRLNGNKEIKH